ncbi:hypothetical protein D3C74_332000 [compost metagenome]
MESLAFAGSDVFFNPSEVAMGFIQDSRNEVAGVNAVLQLVHSEKRRPSPRFQAKWYGLAWKQPFSRTRLQVLLDKFNQLEPDSRHFTPQLARNQNDPVVRQGEETFTAVRVSVQSIPPNAGGAFRLLEHAHQVVFGMRDEIVEVRHRVRNQDIRFALYGLLFHLTLIRAEGRNGWLGPMLASNWCVALFPLPYVAFAGLSHWFSVYFAPA